ncbi:MULTISPECIES: hypothetical protein [Streptomyces]|nr:MULTISPECIES: hypothetical protein [Streptomyces]
MNDFERRMFENSEEVYEQIEQGQCTDVEVALLDAQYKASSDDD